MADASEKLKVFISYSRRDAAEFADDLVAGLELAGFAPFLDRHDIAAGEDWEARLGGLIAQSDTVVFVVTLNRHRLVLNAPAMVPPASGTLEVSLGWTWSSLHRCPTNRTARSCRAAGRRW